MRVLQYTRNNLKEIFGGCNGCGFGVQCHSPGVRGEIVVEGDNIFELLVRRDWEGL